MESGSLSFIGTLVGVLAGVGVLLLGCGYAYGQWMKGKDESAEQERKKNREQTQNNTEVLDLMQKQVDSLTALSKDHTDQLEKRKNEALIMKTQIEEKDKKLQEYIAIFQGRDPRMDTFIATAGQYMETTSKTIFKLQQWLDSQSANTTNAPSI